MPKNYGFIPPVIVKGKDFIVGDGNIVSEILVPDGQWVKYVPSDEMQSGQELDTSACATFGTFNAIETIIARRYGDVVNYSDRLTAKLTGTREKGGNDPHFIAEHIRHTGAANESDWPFVDDYEGYWADPPNSILELMARFLDEYTFKHDYVENKTPESLMEMLKYSPLGVSVPAWFKNANGLYYRPLGQEDTHWCLLVGYVKGKYWIIFDTYDKTIKHYDWESGFEFVKRYHVVRKDITALPPETKKKLLIDKLRLVVKLATLWILNWGHPQKPAPAVPPVAVPEKPRPPAIAVLNGLVLAMREHEGWILPGQTRGGKKYPKGSISFRCNNPLNTRFSSVGYLPKYGTVKEYREGLDLKPGQRGFAQFETLELGMLYGKNLILEKARKHPDWNLYQFIGDEREGWAPASDNNNSRHYAETIAKAIGVSPQTWKLGNLLA